MGSATHLPSSIYPELRRAPPMAAEAAAATSHQELLMHQSDSREASPGAPRLPTTTAPIRERHGWLGTWTRKTQKRTRDGADSGISPKNRRPTRGATQTCARAAPQFAGSSRFEVSQRSTSPSDMALHLGARSTSARAHRREAVALQTDIAACAPAPFETHADHPQAVTLCVAGRGIGALVCAAVLPVIETGRPRRVPPRPTRR
jgi:hypothetical protein